MHTVATYVTCIKCMHNFEHILSFSHLLEVQVGLGALLHTMARLALQN